MVSNMDRDIRGRFLPRNGKKKTVSKETKSKNSKKKETPTATKSKKQAAAQKVEAWRQDSN